ncbi:MAG TPA: gliding motility-associated C-terminal domain-containing protein [Bacteroidales bacterium]|nr:gliding motility-associated C-terminal domain-containing protein [Bacteroidales bacterium]
MRKTLAAYTLIIIHSVCGAQISSPSASAVRYTQYPSLPGVKHPVFIFCNSTGNVKGVLEAVSPGGTGPFTFTWHRWDVAAKDFSIFIKADANVLSSSLTGLDEGGYRVRITDGGGYDTSLVAWVHLDRPYAEAKLQNFTCDYVALSGKVAIDTFYYYDPVNGLPVRLKNAVSFLWSSTPESAIPYPSLKLNPVTDSPPLEDVVYKLQVADSFQCTSESSFPYTSIHVKADFEVSPLQGEAPLEVTFTDKSIRALHYEWKFGDDSVSYLKNPPPHIYYKPGEYYATLIVTSEHLCIDSIRSEKITVDPSELSIPNVFTPDGDGINDYFIVKGKSLRSLSIQIYSRSGMMVYSFEGEGERLSEWQGWDGCINRSSIKAAPGIYFYIVRARGWDDVIYDGKEYRGFFYLYR